MKNTKNMKKACLAALLLAVICAAACGGAEAKTFLSIATGGVAGVYYPLGGGLARIITRHVPDAEAAAESGNASAANVGLIAERRVALALIQNDVGFQAVNGLAPFTAPVKNLSMIASLYPEHVQCVTARDSGIKMFSDLKGRRVSAGAPDSGAAGSLGAIFHAAGLSYSDADFLDFASTAERIQDGQLDAGFVLAGYPTAAVTALAAQKDIDLVAFDDELLDKLTQEYPYFTKDIIPAGTYAGVDHDTPTPAVLAVLVCDSGLPDELVYGITKAVFEHLDELKPAHDKAKLISLEKALDAPSVPVHPGAAKYYAEKGLKLPE